MVKSYIQSEGSSFHQQSGLEFKEEISDVLHCERSFYGAERGTLRK